MTVPVSNKLDMYAKTLYLGYEGLVCMGDSQSSSTSSPRIFRGLTRAFDIPIIGFTLPGNIQAADEGGNVYGGAGVTHTAKNPGETFASEGVVNEWPLTVNEATISANLAAGAVIIRSALDYASFLNNHVRGNWTTSGAMSVRMMFRRTGLEPDPINIVTRREVGVSSTTYASQDILTGANGNAYVDYAFDASDGTHTNKTDAFFAGNTAANETDKRVTLLGMHFHITDATKGLRLCSSIAQGGWGVQNHLDPTADAVNGVYTDAQFESFLSMHFNPRLFRLQIGQNDGALSEADFKTHLTAVCNRILARCAAVGTINPVICLVSPWDTTDSNSKYLAYARIMYEISQVIPEVCTFNLRRAIEEKHGAFSAWEGTYLAVDNVHQNEAGSVEFMSLEFEEIKASLSGSVSRGRNLWTQRNHWPRRI